MKDKHTYAVILAGGTGERLWPLSRQTHPKQFLALGSQPCLLEQTIDRMLQVVHQENLLLVCSENQASLISQSLREKLGTILFEPVQRNTAPATLYAAMTLFNNDPLARLIIVPADHVITPENAFIQAAHTALDFCRLHNVFVLFGIKPTMAATGYGYVECETISTTDIPVWVKKFHEKPSRRKAQLYCKQETMFWNSGMFCGTAQLFIKECWHHAPDIMNAVTKFVTHGTGYQEAPNISLDYAIMEKSTQVYALIAPFQWSDVGNLDTFLSLTQPHQGENTQLIEIGAKNNLIVSNKLTVLIGVNDLCIVETDDALLIAKRSEAEKVKLVLSQIKHQGKDDYL